MKRSTKITLAFIAVVAVIGTKTYIDYKKDIHIYDKQKDSLQKELEEQQEYRRELDGTQDIYTSQSAGENIARETLGLVKSNEKFFKNYNDNQ